MDRMVKALMEEVEAALTYLTLYWSTIYILYPGNGGDPYENYGGRGGGVLVDNVGPACLDCLGYGCGYGGGGGGGNVGFTNYGLQGMVLIETKVKTS